MTRLNTPRASAALRGAQVSCVWPQLSWPVAFPTVVLENHADKCDISQSNTWRIIETVIAEGEAQNSLKEGLKSYRDVEKRKYIHLVDGGIADNLGLRAALDRVESLGEARLSINAEKPMKNMVFILVNAGVASESTMEQTAKNPSAAATMGAFTSAQIERYSQETLELEDDQIDQLIIAGRILLRQEPSYRRFLERNGGRLTEGAMNSREICKHFPLDECQR